MQRFPFPRPITVLSLLALAAPAFGIAPPGPLSGYPNNEHVIYLSSPNMDYAVSDYGWSDSWLVGPQTSPSSSHDLLTGDDAANIQYTINGTKMPTIGNGWLSPTLDDGSGDPAHNTNSAWTVKTATLNSSNDTPSATSVVTDGNLVVTITTTLSGPTLRQTFHITNNTSSPITNLNFADFLNLHPSGTAQYSNPGDTVLPRQFGVAEVLSAGVGSLYFTQGSPQPTQPDSPIPLVADGYMQGDRFPDGFVVGSVSSVVTAVQNGTYNNLPGPTYLAGTDAAGAFEFNLGSLAPGASVDISINKGLGTPPVPEPATLGLFATGASLALFRRKNRAT